jgi:hypothetical protein
MTMGAILEGVPINVLLVDGGRVRVVPGLEEIMVKVGLGLITTITQGGGKP